MSDGHGAERPLPHRPLVGWSRAGARVARDTVLGAGAAAARGPGWPPGCAAAGASPRRSQPGTTVAFPRLSCLTLCIYLNSSAEKRFFFLYGWLCA